jgi:hypothetical protein
MLKRKYLDQIRPEYSRVYRIKDSVVVSANASNGQSDESVSYGTSKSPVSRTTEAPPKRRDTPSFAVLTAHSSCGAGTGATSDLFLVLASLMVASAVAAAAGLCESLFRHR